jgi:hypothetical protein
VIDYCGEVAARETVAAREDEDRSRTAERREFVEQPKRFYRR